VFAGGTKPTRGPVGTGQFPDFYEVKGAHLLHQQLGNSLTPLDRHCGRSICVNPDNGNLTSVTGIDGAGRVHNRKSLTSCEAAARVH
jgi:hypothetical protein